MISLAMQTNALLPIVLVAFWLASCAQPGANKGGRGNEVARIEKGVTTEQQLVAQLGEPQVRGLDSKGRKMLIWNRMDVSSTSKGWMTVIGQFLPRTDTVHEQELEVSFDPYGRVAAWRVKNERHRYR